MKTVQPPGGKSDAARRDVTSWVSVCPGGLWQVQRKWTVERKKGFVTPVLGSVCKVRVHCKGSPEKDPPAQQSDQSVESTSPSAVQATSYPRTPEAVLQIPLEEWVQVRVGEGQCDVIEACLDGMKAEEMCEFQVMPFNKDSTPKISGSSSQSEDQDASKGECTSYQYILELHSFTPGKESWEMTSGEKWTWVKSHKERGGQRFGKGDMWGASDSYCRAMKLLITLTERRNGKKDSKNDDKEEQGHTEASSLAAIEESKEGHSKELEAATEQDHVPTEDEYTGLKADLHSNLSLCQLKLNQPAKARASSLNATQLDPASTKAWYRLGQASLLVGELQDARQAFEKVLEIQPNSASARQALKQVNMKEKEVDNKLGQRLSKMFT
ncbi:FK506-binding protein-like [Alosa pseudoharengus]|uniref:FK506-binding protein-like n=1 Tax=Alosa pseudoharengus TaxID=34774 RepID=UPI003F887724